MPWHRIQDGLEEDRLARKGAAFGSTRRGIAYAYSDKYRKKTLRLGDLLRLDTEPVRTRLKTMLEAKNLELGGCYYQEPMSYPALLAWCQEKAETFEPYICDTGRYLRDALAAGKRVLLEAQLGAMRDIDYGIFPYTSSSSTISAYGPIGAGIPGCRLDHVVGVLKAYSTCVGAGPFAAEHAMSAAWMDQLREAAERQRRELLEGMDEVKDSLAQRRFQLRMDQAEWLEERERDLDELRSRLEEARGRYIFGQKRLLAAFPRMRSLDHRRTLERLRRWLEKR